MNRVFIKTYGCQMNERDSEDVAAKLLSRGYEIVTKEADADIVLLNTCSVREQAEQKAIGKAGHLLSANRADKPFILGVMGCMAQNLGSGLLNELPKLDLVVGTQKFHRIPDYLDQLTNSVELGSRKVVSLNEELGSQNRIKDHLNRSNIKVSAFVSIMQGCNMNCSFCIVPKTRGKERYRPINEIVSEVSRLAEAGTKEVTLLGQIVNAYGRRLIPKVKGKTAFVQLLESIHEIEGIERIRFTSPHPTSFGKDLIEAFARLPKLGEYAHLPMQSGSNKILKSMKRPYSVEKFLTLVSNLRSTMPNMRLSTDVIVGYPNETEEDFQLTKSAFQRAGFEMAFIFKYSRRGETPAAKLPDQVPNHIKEARNQELLSVLERQSLQSNKRLLGSKMEILVESEARKGRGDLLGKTKCFRKVLFRGEKSLIGRLVEVEIEQVETSTLRARIT